MRLSNISITVVVSVLVTPGMEIAFVEPAFLSVPDGLAGRKNHG